MQAMLGRRYFLAIQPHQNYKFKASSPYSIIQACPAQGLLCWLAHKARCQGTPKYWDGFNPGLMDGLGG